jgi:uroporphyrinogen decarboxylase
MPRSGAFTRGAVRSHCGHTMQAGPAIDQNHDDDRRRPREVVGRALRGAESSVVPRGPLAVHFCARLAGITIQEYSTNAGALAESVIRYHERFRPDAVWVSADTWVSAEAMGAAVIAPDHDQPLCGSGEPRVRTARDIDRLPSPDPGSQGRYPVMLDALERVRRAIGSEAFVVACFDQYPFSLAAALVGLDQIMLKLSDDPPFVAGLMERCLEFGRAYAVALGGAGADMLSGGDSPAGLIGPRAYREVVWPFEQRLIADIQARTGKPVSLHICGNSRPILEDMAGSGADVLELDHEVDLEEACRLAGPNIALWGNLDPVGLLARGSPGEVRAAVRRAEDTVRSCGHARFILSSGCTLAVETPFENLDAMLRSPS